MKSRSQSYPSCAPEIRTVDGGVALLVASPTATMEHYLLAAGFRNALRFISFLQKQMSVICGDDELGNTEASESLDGSSHVVYGGLHDLPGQGRADVFSQCVNFKRANK